MHLHKTKKMKRQLMEVSSPPMVPGPKLRRSDLAASDDNLASPQVSHQLSIFQGPAKPGKKTNGASPFLTEFCLSSRI